MSSQPRIPINNEKYKESILTALADGDMVNVMNSAVIQPKSISDIIKETDISHTTAYRKAKWMVENGLLVIEKIVVSKDGKKFSLLKSVFKSINIKYEYDRVTVEIEQNVDVLHKVAQRIFSLDS
ncbi:MAG: hypothetical protein E6K93_05475 [Thaumarchaeota archaeon]|nr:MAG: hypothetical protein E6K93_05475 [Nitrososphaerota archaeon]